MIFESLVFYLFSTILLVCGVMVITMRNPVHSVLFLVVGFFQAAGLFILMGAEFLALILVIVYVGAVSVLFLFVVMMLDVDFATLRRGFFAYLPAGMLVGAVLLTELVVIAGSWVVLPEASGNVALAIPPASEMTNTEALGRVLYTEYVYLFQASGVVLLIAMIGAIVLTLRTRDGVRRQSVPEQFARDPKEVVEVRKVPARGGLS